MNTHPSSPASVRSALASDGSQSMKLALAAFNEARFEDAARLCESLLAVHPEAFAPNYLLALARSRSGDLEAALSSYDRALIARPGAALPAGCIFDGEIIAPDTAGRPIFADLIRRRAHPRLCGFRRAGGRGRGLTIIAACAPQGHSPALGEGSPALDRAHQSSPRKIAVRGRRIVAQEPRSGPRTRYDRTSIIVRRNVTCCERALLPFPTWRAVRYLRGAAWPDSRSALKGRKWLTENSR